MFAGRIWQLELIEPTARSRFALGCASVEMVSRKITGFLRFTGGPIRRRPVYTFVIRKSLIKNYRRKRRRPFLKFQNAITNKSSDSRGPLKHRRDCRRFCKSVSVAPENNVKGASHFRTSRQNPFAGVVPVIFPASRENELPSRFRDRELLFVMPRATADSLERSGNLCNSLNQNVFG